MTSRPRTRADCADGPRPCSWVSCRHHLLSDAKRETRLEDLPDTCALDVAGRGDHALAEVASFLGGLSRERIRQIEAAALQKLQATARAAELAELLEVGRAGSARP